ncbi:MAG: urease accessory UreF family protein [Pseudomonadota bacterium]
MTTELLTLTQWLSPAFPLGSFAYSHGLETAISDGKITNAASLEAWLRVVLTQGSGWNDAVLLCAAQRGEDVCQLARALAGSRERLEETNAQGKAFALTLRAIGPDIDVAPLPVAVGLACRGFKTEPHVIAGIYLQSFISNLVQCAVRFVPLGQSDGQAVLSRLAGDIATTAERASQASIEELGSGAFFSDLSAMRHEAQEARVFKT